MVMWPVCPPCFLEGFSSVVIVVDSSLPVFVPLREPLITHSPPLIILRWIFVNERVILVEHMIEYYEFVEYCQ
jgi:hypothetical protein